MLREPVRAYRQSQNLGYEERDRDTSCLARRAASYRVMQRRRSGPATVVDRDRDAAASASTRARRAGRQLDAPTGPWFARHLGVRLLPDIDDEARDRLGH